MDIWKPHGRSNSNSKHWTFSCLIGQFFNGTKSYKMEQNQTNKRIQIHIKKKVTIWPIVYSDYIISTALLFGCRPFNSVFSTAVKMSSHQYAFQRLCYYYKLCWWWLVIQLAELWCCLKEMLVKWWLVAIGYQLTPAIYTIGLQSWYPPRSHECP